MIEVYTDGAYSSTKNMGGVGFVILEDGKKIYEYSSVVYNTTNNKCELLSIILVLKSLLNYKEEDITIYSDSQYSIGMATKQWEAKKNKKLVTILRVLLKRYTNIKFIHIRGHKGNKWNEYVDYLAVEAYKTVN